MINKTAITIVVIFLAVNTSFAQKKAPKLDELDRLRNDIENFRKTLASKSNEEKTVIGNLREIDHEINLRSKLLIKLSREENSTSSRINNNKRDLRRSKRTLDELKSLFRDRAVKMYKYGAKSTVEMLFDTGSLSSTAALRKYYRNASRRDENLISTIKERAKQIESLTGSLEKDLIRKKKLIEAKQGEADILSSKKKDKENILTAIKNDKNFLTVALAEKQRAEKELLKVITNITTVEEEKNINLELPDFKESKGKLSWPVGGELITKAGIEKNPNTRVQIQNKGVEILTNHGESVRAVGMGEIARIKWLPWYGQTVFIRHSDGYYTVYARLEQVYVNIGDIVAVDQVVGTVGKDAATSQAKLNFQVWKGSENLNPENWLSRNKNKNTILTGSMKKNRP